MVYKHCLEEMAVDVPSRTCITKNRISVDVDGALYIKVVDPVKASYGTKDNRSALIRMAGTTMCTEIGKMAFDEIFVSRENLNSTIAAALNEASAAWGVEVIRCEIKDIKYEQFAKA